MKDQNEKITKLESEVSLLQKHAQFLKQANGTCALNHNEIEQYRQRQCLWLEGVPVKENESPSDLLNFVNPTQTSLTILLWYIIDQNPKKKKSK